MDTCAPDLTDVAEPAEGRPGPDWLPMAPMTERVERAGGLRACGLRTRGDTSTEQERLAKAYYRARRRGWVQLYHADELATEVLGVHPLRVWGEEWVAAVTGVAARPAAAELADAVTA